MARRATVWASWIGIALLWTYAQGAERPLAEAIRAAADAVRPAVVGIEVRGRRPAAIQRETPQMPFVVPQEPGERRGPRFEFRWPPGGEEPMLPFGEQFPLFRGRRETAAGSGVIVSVEGDRGLIAAPSSLLAGAEEILVTLADGRQLAAKLLGSDKFTGLGALEVRDKKLAAARPAKGDAAQVGDWVLAVGGPASGGAVTLGIVSTTKQHGEGDLAITQVIETDNLVTEDMAGGALVNLKGEMLGMTLLAAGRTTAGRQLAATLPASTVDETVSSLAKTGKMPRGWLGVMFRPLGPAELNRLKIDHGIQVVQVLEGQPAAKAGIEAEDVLLEIDGKKIADVDAFRAMVASKKPGTRVTLKLLRDGKEKTAEVTLGEQGGEQEAQAMPGGGEKLALGLTLQPLTPGLANQFGYAGAKGLVVVAVEPGSPAANARPAPIEQGDLIAEVAGKPVSTLADARKAIEEARKAEHKSLLVLVRGKQGVRYVVLDLPQ